ncbi:MAG: hypothetical protein L6305_05440, partial [Actinomycetia bacterium]|nr:hypothetical protein [Actinomycetes bacterium]
QNNSNDVNMNVIKESAHNTEESQITLSNNILSELDKKYSGSPEFEEKIVNQIKRPSELRNAILNVKSTTCQLCNYPGFKKKDGSFYARKGWMSTLGLDSGYSHLWNDPDVREGLAKKIGEESINITREQTKLSRSFIQPVPWMSAWVVDLEREISRALVKEISVDESIKNLTLSWEKKKQ